MRCGCELVAVHPRDEEEAIKLLSLDNSLELLPAEEEVLAGVAGWLRGLLALGEVLKHDLFKFQRGGKYITLLKDKLPYKKIQHLR